MSSRFVVRLEDWFLAISVFVAIAMALMFFRKLLSPWLVKQGDHLREGMGRDLVEYVRRPFTFLIFVISFSIASQLIPVPFQSHKLLITGTKVLFILGGIFLIDSIVRGLFAVGVFKINATDSTRFFIRRIVRIFIFALTLLVVLDTLGISISPILASLGVGSLAVALALQDTLSNFFSGLYILADKPVEINDYIKIESGLEGYVTQVGWRSTQLLTIENSLVVIPNSKLSSSIVVNQSRPMEDAIFNVEFILSNQNNLEMVESIALETAKRLQSQAGPFPDFVPHVLFSSVEDKVKLKVVLKVARYVDTFQYRHECLKRLHTEFLKNNIKMA